MKKSILSLLIATTLICATINAQQRKDYSKIDIKLVHAEYDKVIDTCKLILASDTANSEIYYKMGLAYQNLLQDDKAFDCFQQASAIAPDNSIYKFMVAKGFFIKNKLKQAEPLLISLCEADSLNWLYSYYLTSIYMQEGKYDESLKIYTRFYKKDSTNYVFMDKLGFALLRKGNYDEAIDMFNKSLAINKVNNNAIKNLAFLYSNTHRIDTATMLLTRAIKTDPTDMDLYARRAAIYFSTDNNKRSLNDYLRILSSGDSITLYLKRAGIGYTRNLQPREGNIYLRLAHLKDTTDFEVLTLMARNYIKLEDRKSAQDCYSNIVKILTPLALQLEYTYIDLAMNYKSEGQYKKAIENYLISQRMGPDVNINAIVANIYDEKLKDSPSAIYYYQLFLNNYKESVMPFSDEYIQSVRDRVDFLIKKQKENQQKPAVKK